MKTWQKLMLGTGLAVLVGGGAWFGVYKLNKGVLAVQTGLVLRQDLTSIVTASGEIRPKNVYERPRRRDWKNHRHHR